MRKRRGLGKQRGPREVWLEWTAADEAADADKAAALAAELLELTPRSYFSWFHAGLLSKARCNWPEVLERNVRALEFFTPADAKDFDGVNPAAWNLGIAATAMSDWTTARQAWTAYGVEGMGSGTEPIDGDFGQAPVRLNPDQPSLPHQVMQWAGATEVVWCWRRSPAHAIISNVPLPESGHRFRDVILHDGEPKGTRRLGGREVAVFDQLQRLEDSGLPTWQAQVAGATGKDLQELSDLIERRGLGMDDWSGMRLLCSQCSHGSPDGGHHHPATPAEMTRLGLAGREPELTQTVEAWAAARPWLDFDLALLW